MSRRAAFPSPLTSSSSVDGGLGTLQTLSKQGSAERNIPAIQRKWNVPLLAFWVLGSPVLNIQKPTQSQLVGF
jgi:hypothetical protein